VTAGRLLLAAALVVALPLSGCNAVPGGDDPSAPTATPAPVPTDGRDSGATAAAPTVAPGVDERGVVSAVDLAAAHREALLSTTFTRSVEEIIRGPNGTLRRTNRTTRAEFDPIAYRYVRNQSAVEGYPVQSFATRFELWSNDSRAVSRVVRNGSVSYRSDRAVAFGEAVTSITGNEAIIRLFSAFEFRVDSTEDGYRLRSTRLLDARNFPVPMLTEDVSNATMTARISEAGVVRSYRVAYDATLRDRRVRIVERAEVRALGETTVERPGWYDAATANATATDAGD